MEKVETVSVGLFDLVSESRINDDNSVCSMHESILSTLNIEYSLVTAYNAVLISVD